MHPQVAFRRILRCALAVVLLGALACSSGQRKLYPVKGKVLCDGKPAEGALVSLYALDASQPMKQFPAARVQRDGSFEVGTYVEKDGAPAGEYKVVVVWLPQDAADRVSPSGRYPNMLPDLYSEPKTTPLKLQVKEAANDVPPYELPSPKGSRR